MGNHQINLNKKQLEWTAYVPSKSIPFVTFLTKKHDFELKIVNQRQTKHGDFRMLPSGKFQITINNNLNPHQFLLTLVHEIAHHVTHQKFGRVQPHGKEWKTIFQHLMLPFLKPDIYPHEILVHLAKYLKNPKASTDSDTELAWALKGKKASEGKKCIFEIPEGSLFLFRNDRYRKGRTRRTRIECEHVDSRKKYLFNKNVEIVLYEPS